MGKIMKFVKNKRFIIAVFFIIVLSAVLRFYNYENRWGLAYDQARDVLVAREALKTQTLPLIGPFASAGQFVYGPQWYWILMIMTGIYPKSVILPWIIQTLLYSFAVLIMIAIGKEIGGRLLGLTVGLLSAVSMAQVAQSTNLTSPSMVGIFSILSLYFFIKYLKYQKNIDAFWMAFLTATAINIHFQAIGLFVFIPIAFIFDAKKSVKKILSLMAGVFIPFIPLTIFDLTNNFFESRNWIDYYLYGQYRVFVPNRWLTYLGVYWPLSWAKVIGGEKIIGYAIIFLLPIVAFFSYLSKRMEKSLMAIIISFLSIIIMLRYYRGERIDSNLIFLQPFILFLTGWLIFKITKLNFILGLGAIAIIVFSSLKSDIELIKNSENLTAIQVREWKNIILDKFPNKKFAVYDHQYRNVHKSLPLVLFLESSGKMDDRGVKLGFYIATSKTNFKYPSIIGNRGGYQVLNLNNRTENKLAKEEWAFVNPSQLYHSTVKWYKK